MSESTETAVEDYYFSCCTEQSHQDSVRKTAAENSSKQQNNHASSFKSPAPPLCSHSSARLGSDLAISILKLCKAWSRSVCATFVCHTVTIKQRHFAQRTHVCLSPCDYKMSYRTHVCLSPCDYKTSYRTHVCLSPCDYKTSLLWWTLQSFDGTTHLE